MGIDVGVLSMNNLKTRVYGKFISECMVEEVFFGNFLDNSGCIHFY